MNKQKKTSFSTSIISCILNCDGRLPSLHPQNLCHSRSRKAKSNRNQRRKLRRLSPPGVPKRSNDATGSHDGSNHLTRSTKPFTLRTPKAVTRFRVIAIESCIRGPHKFEVSIAERASNNRVHYTVVDAPENPLASRTRYYHYSTVTHISIPSCWPGG